MQELTLPAVMESIPKVTAFIDGALEALDCPMKAQMQIDVAVDELFSNIVRYAYGDGMGDATVRFSFDEQERAAEITFLDSGVPFDPLAKADPDVTLTVEEREIGGLGIFLVKKTMDSLAYRYEDGKNVLTLRKRI